MTKQNRVVQLATRFYVASVGAFGERTVLCNIAHTKRGDVILTRNDVSTDRAVDNAVAICYNVFRKFVRRHLTEDA